MNLKEVQNSLDEERGHLESIAVQLQALAGERGTPDSAAPALPLHVHYGIYRGYIEHEDGLINSRLLWNITIQGFLFATYGFSVQKLAEVLSDGRAPSDQAGIAGLKILIWVLPIFGLLISFLSWIGVVASRNAIKKLKAEWEDDIYKKRINPVILPSVTGGGAENSHNLGLWAPFCFPWIFMLTWAVLFVGYLFGPWILSKLR